MISDSSTTHTADATSGADHRRVGRPPGPTRDKRERRDELLDAATEAIGAHGADVSMQQIADTAGVTRPILNQHFGDRTGLAAALLDRHARRITATFAAEVDRSAPPVDAIVTAIDAFLAFAESSPELYTFLRIAAVSNETTTSLDDIAGNAIVDMLRDVLGDGDEARAEVLGRAILAMTLGVSEWWMLASALPRKVVVTHLTEILRAVLDEPPLPTDKSS